MISSIESKNLKFEINDNIKLSEDLLSRMLKVRIVEEKIAELYREQEMRCPVHLCIGQDQLDQTNMEKVVRHFVDEVWCAGPIHTGLIDKLLTETLEHRGV